MTGSENCYKDSIKLKFLSYVYGGQSIPQLSESQVFLFMGFFYIIDKFHNNLSLSVLCISGPAL